MAGLSLVFTCTKAFNDQDFSGARTRGAGRHACPFRQHSRRLGGL